MAELAPPPMNQDLYASTLAAPARLDEGLNPPAFAAGEQAAKKQEILDYLAIAELLNLSTISSNDWPISHCMHFATCEGPDQRPVIYMFTQDNTRKLANIAANPRVAVTVAPSAPVDCATGQPQIKLQGIASVVESDQERDIAMQAMFGKVNYEFARFIGLETQPAIRVDVLNAIWTSPAADAAPGHVDYADTITAA